MKFRGKLDGISVDYKSRKQVLNISVTECNLAEAERLIDHDLSIEFKEYRDSRSLNANALLWHCLGEIAVALGGDKWKYYLQALRKYGKYTMISVRSNAVEQFKQAYRECEEVGKRYDSDGNEYVDMLCYFGSSTYDSKEFSVLLDGVIEDMKQAGLETPTSEEMRRTIEALERSERNGKESRSRRSNAGEGSYEAVSVLR